MSPVVKYTLGRFGLFLVFLAVLMPIPYPENFFVKAMIAVFASAGASLVLMRRWRDEMAEQLSSTAQKRKAEKERLRAALAGDEAAAADGDRAATKPVDPPA
jgi:hypothetical protein